MAAVPGGVVVARPEEVLQKARSNGVRATLFSGLDPIRTVVEASDALGRDLGEVGNTILVTVNEEPMLVVVPGDRRLDGGRVAAHFGVDALDVSLAQNRESLEHTGYPVGMIPPFDLEAEMPLLIDEKLLEHDTVLLPSGSADALIEADPADLAELPDAEVGAWSSAVDE